MRRLRALFLIAGAAGVALVAGAVLLSSAQSDSTRQADAAPRTAPPVPVAATTTTRQRARPRPSVVEPPAGGSAAPEHTDIAPRQPKAAPPESEPPGSPATLPQPDRTVYVQGDSLAVDTEPYLRGRLPGWTVETSAEIGRGTAAGVRLIRSRAGSLPQVIVVGLGTNDDANLPGSFAAEVDKVLRLAGPGRCVVWVDVWRPYRGDHFERFNNILASREADNANLVVVPWARAAAAHPSWFRFDAVHPTDAGYQARAALIAEAVHGCVGI